MRGTLTLSKTKMKGKKVARKVRQLKAMRLPRAMKKKRERVRVDSSSSEGTEVAIEATEVDTEEIEVVTEVTGVDTEVIEVETEEESIEA